jgi:anaerobic dimethyl sulfoxide reductase subunit A
MIGWTKRSVLMAGLRNSSRTAENVSTGVLDRRGFVKWSAILGGTVALTSGLTACAPASEDSGGSNAELSLEEGEWKPAACKQQGSCGDTCANFALVKDGVVIRMKTDDTREDTPNNPLRKGCLRGRAWRSFSYGEGRLRYPMKRKNWQPGGGENVNGHLRGIDEWERISWDEALDLTATEIKRILDTYGNTSILEGSKWLNILGGTALMYGVTSEGAYPQVGLHLTGSLPGGADRFAQQDAKLVVYWGMNSAWSSPMTITYNIQQIRKAGARIIVVSPEYNASAVALGAEWIPVRPSTDCALLLGMAYHILEENLHDQDFLNRCCIGFDADHMPEGENSEDNFKDYILGTYDGVPKTPEWAAEICGVAPEKIRSFAQDIATTKPLVMDSSNAPFRTDRGYQFGQAFFTVGWMIGNVGLHASEVARDSARGFTNIPIVSAGWDGELGVNNPLFPGVEKAGPYGSYSYSDPFDTDSLLIAYEDAWNAILTGEYTALSRGKQPIDIKMFYAITQGSNKMETTGGTIKAVEAMRKLDFVVACDVVLSAKSKYADVVFPDTLQWEMEGFVRYGGNSETLVFCQKLIEPLFECKDLAWVESELAARFGIDKNEVHPIEPKQRFYNQIASSMVMNPDTGENEPIFTITQDDIVTLGVDGTPQDGKVPIMEGLQKGVYTADRHKGDAYEAMAEKPAADFRNDPEANPLTTESGKLEIYCRNLKKYLEAYGFDDNVEPIARYIPPRDGYESTFSDWEGKIKGDFPLQSITPHNLGGARTTYNNVPWIRRAHPREITLNMIDANERGIKRGDTVLVSSPYGQLIRRANVTNHVMPGVILIPHGKWSDYDPESGIDKGGCSNTVVGARPSGQGMEPYNTLAVQVEKWAGDPMEPDYTWPQRVPIKDEE